MSEQLSEATPEVKLYPGVISDTIDRHLGYQALLTVNEVLGGE
jgi:hypothetical protein